MVDVIKVFVSSNIYVLFNSMFWKKCLGIICIIIYEYRFCNKIL